MLKIFDGFLKGLTAVFEIFTQVMLAVMVAIITWLVFSRLVLNNASTWAEEISLVMIIWFSLIGATFGVRDRFHLRVEMLFSKFPDGVKVPLNYLIDFIIVCTGALLVYGGLQHCALTMDQTLPATKLPKVVQYIPIPLTGAMIILYGVRNMLGGGSRRDALGETAAANPHVTPQKEN